MRTLKRLPFFLAPPSIDDLSLAIYEPDNKYLKKIITKSPDLINSKNHQDMTPLMLAVVASNYEAINILLSHGADENIVDSDRWSARAWAIFIGDSKALHCFKGLSRFHCGENSPLVFSQAL